MCGIFAIINQYNNDEISNIEKFFEKGRKRGPEFSEFCKLDPYVIFGFHRLAINGLNNNSNQPIHHNSLVLICNGEIYNYNELITRFGINMKGNSDCEVIIHLYELIGTKCFDLLDGVFACIIYDMNKQEIIIARDPYGVRPLYYCLYKETNRIGFSSDISPLLFTTEEINIQQFPPGRYARLCKNSYGACLSNQFVFDKLERYFFLDSIQNTRCITNEIKPIEYYMFNTVELLKNSIKKRVYNCERDIASLLSGGLDSSIVSAYVSRFYKEKHGTSKHLETYSIGLENASDLRFSSLVANHIGSKHTNITVTTDMFLESIKMVIRDIETFDTTTVRASTGNWNVAKYIKQNSDARVIFNGDGADELMGGYLYFHLAPDSHEFDKECKRLLNDISHFDVLRSDKSISSHGLEPRTPFLDKEFTKFFLSIPTEYRFQMDKCEKYFIRKSIEQYDPELLPQEVLWRTKEAFSDGVSSTDKSWYEHIKEHLVDYVPKQVVYPSNMNVDTKEKQYYYDVFIEEFTHYCVKTLPYYWMPRFIENATDSSARTLDIYKKVVHNQSV